MSCESTVGAIQQLGQVVHKQAPPHPPSAHEGNAQFSRMFERTLESRQLDRYPRDETWYNSLAMRPQKNSLQDFNLIWIAVILPSNNQCFHDTWQDTKQHKYVAQRTQDATDYAM